MNLLGFQQRKYISAVCTVAISIDGSNLQQGLIIQIWVSWKGSTCRVFLCHTILTNNRQLFITFAVYYYYFSLRWGQQDRPNWIWPKRLERTMLPNDPYCILEVMVCPKRAWSWRWAWKEPQENAQCSIAHWHTITWLWIWSMTQSMMITLLTEAKDRWKCLICLFSNVAICLMNEIDFIKCQGYLLVSN